MSLDLPRQQQAKSYARILHSSSILGATQIITYGLGLVRIKVLAVVLGPAGVGLWGYFQSVLTTAVAISSLGVPSSGIRQIAEAAANDKNEKVVQIAATLVRFSWLSALIGLCVMCALAVTLSNWSFGSSDHVTGFCLLGIAIVFTAVSNGQTAVLQGLRRLSEFARVNVIAALIGTIITVICIYTLGERGIAISLVASALLSFVISSVVYQRLNVASATTAWRESAAISRSLLGLGLAFMWSGLLTSAAALLTRMLLVQELGISAAGVYQAAWGISGLFAGFILGAMGTDYYPRLTAVASDPVAAARLINQQTEIGLLLALPGLVGTLVFGRELMFILYSKEFSSGADMLPWFVLGVLGRVSSWPLGFLLLARGMARWFAIVETLATAFGLLATYFLMLSHGLGGVAGAFALLYVLHNMGMLLFMRRLIGFVWNLEVWVLLAVSGTLILLSALSRKFLPHTIHLSVGLLLSVSAAFLSARGLVERLPSDNRLVRLMADLGLSRALGIKVTS